MIGALLQGVSLIAGYFKNKQRIKAKRQERQDQLEQAVTDAQTKRIEQGDASAADLDAISLKGRGWKDEYLLVLTTAPLILTFIPDFAPYVAEGFAALKENVPEYFWYALAMVYIDTFGFRRMLRVAFEHWINKRLGVK
ncbi:hypothetical protein [Vibrio panuliri]|uniref:Uncharacterized protein n=1 Tax=Vibrio panuliri TaxID=1381081 RepID=A0ABX3FG59_9VIBR|nr:hypothetical protein [Vibrio panuliri]KAB1457408.1 hypothetical protein F7O85_06610 [Vibrio panuliri]OLQ91431.1 hypothetical protein BIY20_01070 [Vibrio panuliri]